MTSRVKVKLPPAMKLYSDVTNAIAAETGINKDIIKTENTWGWVDYETKESTWNKNYML